MPSSAKTSASCRFLLKLDKVSDWNEQLEKPYREYYQSMKQVVDSRLFKPLQKFQFYRVPAEQV